MHIDKNAVYGKLKKIPRGKVTTYASLAKALHTKAYRAIGQILKKNPDAPVVPCHRVVKSDGTLGGYMGHMSGTHTDKKKKMLEQEGIRFKGKKLLEFQKVYINIE